MASSSIQKIFSTILLLLAVLVLAVAATKQCRCPDTKCCRHGVYTLNNASTATAAAGKGCKCPDPKCCLGGIYFVNNARDHVRCRRREAMLLPNGSSLPTHWASQR